MSHYTLNRVFLVLGILLVPGAGGQEPEDVSSPSVKDVIVRPVRDIGTLERVTIALTRAFIPGSKVFSPLYAYGREIACSDSADSNQTVVKHRGPAALVYDDNGIIRARFHQTTADAIRDAENRGLCEKSNATTWSFATTYPLDGNDIEVKQRYLSREVERIDLQLHARRD